MHEKCTIIRFEIVVFRFTGPCNVNGQHRQCGLDLLLPSSEWARDFFLLQILQTLCVAHPSNTHRIDLMSGALTGPNSRPTWKPKFRSNRNCIIVWISTRVLRTSPARFLGLWKLPLLSVARLETHAPRSRPVFRMKYA